MGGVPPPSAAAQARDDGAGKGDQGRGGESMAGGWGGVAAASRVASSPTPMGLFCLGFFVLRCVRRLQSARVPACSWGDVAYASSNPQLLCALTSFPAPRSRPCPPSTLAALPGQAARRPSVSVSWRRRRGGACRRRRRRGAAGVIQRRHKAHEQEAEEEVLRLLRHERGEAARLGLGRCHLAPGAKVESSN